MVKKVDLTGQRFGSWMVLGESGKDNNNKILWRCLCECGETRDVSGNSIRRGVSTSCGCKKNVDLTNNQFGDLRVLSKLSERKRGSRIWRCQCSCGNYVDVATTYLTSGKYKSCGCSRLKYVGENHPMYNPNLTDEERFERRGRDQILWSKQIMERDNYTCQICNHRGGNHNAHHLNGWNTFPEQRFDLDNGVTLCTDCHKEFHSQYGYGDNTREQFNDYAASKTLVLN